MQKAINKVTFVTLTQVLTKLDIHIEKMNVDGWELMSIAVEAVGIEENFVLFWRKVVEVPNV